MCLRRVDVTIWFVKKLLVELQTIHIDLDQAVLFALSDLSAHHLESGVIIFRIKCQV